MNQQELTKLLVDSYKQAPPPIQRFISSGALSKFVEQTKDKYKLHIDVAGRLSDEITMLMVGITDPKEFIQNIASQTLVPEDSLDAIVAEINEKIFVPLMEEMRKGPPVEVKPMQVQIATRTTMISSNPQLPQRPAQTLASVPRYVPPKKYFNLQNKIPPASPTLPVLKQADSNRLLEDHEEPHIEFKKTASPPPNLPGVIQPTPILQPPAQPTPPVPPPAPVESYSTDPYREPVE